jgi:hypothetical protein
MANSSSEKAVLVVDTVVDALKRNHYFKVPMQLYALINFSQAKISN